MVASAVRAPTPGWVIRRGASGCARVAMVIASSSSWICALSRRRLGLSQVAFARQAGISRNGLVAYERGDWVPKTVPVARIAEAGGISVDRLLNGRIPQTTGGGRDAIPARAPLPKNARRIRRL